MKEKVVTGIINGISLQFIDLENSVTVPCVFEELGQNIYGLEDVVLTKDDVVIDIGANVGMFSIYVKKKFNCEVISFEPIPINFEHFKQNIILNGLKLEDFSLHNSAVSSKDEDFLILGVPYGNTGGSSILHKNLPLSFSCPTETIDKYITDKCKYLKIDCEGGEYDIIPSILEKLNAFEYIGIEYHVYQDQFTVKDIANLDTLIRKNFNGKLFHNNF